MISPPVSPASVIVGALAFGVVTGLGVMALTTQDGALGRAAIHAPAVVTSHVAQALDANGDRVISDVEIAAAPISLRRLDRNGDGALTADEITPAEANALVAVVDPIVAALDVNRDGVLSGVEMAQPHTLHALDRNHDGRLTADETRARTPDRNKRLRPNPRRATAKI